MLLKQCLHSSSAGLPSTCQFCAVSDMRVPRREGAQHLRMHSMRDAPRSPLSSAPLGADLPENRYRSRRPTRSSAMPSSSRISFPAQVAGCASMAIVCTAGGHLRADLS